MFPLHKCTTLRASVLAQFLRCRFSSNATGDIRGQKTVLSDDQTQRCAFQQCRLYGGKKSAQIPPKYPVHFDYSGDLAKQEPIDLTLPRVEFAKSEELKQAEEVVKKLFSLQYSDGRAVRQYRIEDTINNVMYHAGEKDTIEYRIALLTVLIRNQMEHCLISKKDKRGKSALVGRIQARKKYLRKLRQTDYDRFLMMLDKLKIKYTPTPEDNRRPTRRQLIEKGVQDEADALKKQKFEALKSQFQEELIDFLKYKEETLQQLAVDLKDIKLENPDINIQEVLDKIESYTTK